MKIKTDGTAYMISPEEILNFLGVETNKYVVIDKDSNDFVLQEENEYITKTEWNIEEIDGRRFRKVKKDILEEFGNITLSEYGTTNRVYETLSKKFINTSGVSSVLKNSIANGMNVILFGKGGFGKSEMISELFGRPELKNRVFIKSLSEATNEEDLFGGVNIKKLTETGIMEYYCENSFANKEIVVFEEIFDANPRVLAALKDTLTSKEIRNGNQRFPIKTKLIIGLTNKTYDEVIQDNSTEALTQRFPVSFKLEYDLTPIDVASLILNRYKDYDTEKLTAIIKTYHELKDVTPRKILETAKYIRTLEIRKNKKYDEQITNNNISTIIKFLKYSNDKDISGCLIKPFVITEKDLRDEVNDDYDRIVDIVNNAKVIELALKPKLSAPVVDSIGNLFLTTEKLVA